MESDPRSGVQALARKARSSRRAERADRTRVQRLLKHERRLWGKGIEHIAGVDEVGRGPLAGPVVAAAVVLPQDARIKGLDDSKALTVERREELYEEISDTATDWALGAVDAEEIDRINIYQATLKAMRIAIGGLKTAPERVLVDGNRVPDSGCNELAIIGGDAASQSIAAASVIAKVTRDREMTEWSRKYPAYGFESHKGYASEQHTSALMDLGPCPIHRRSFSTVEDALASWSEAFQEVRAIVDKIRRLRELEAYRKNLDRRSSELSPEEVTEINRRIDRRASQLRQPGIAGEEAAEQWLEQSGYMILERNVRLGRGEIDLIVQRGDTLAFVEVKTGSGSASEPESRITRQKQSRICSAAESYLSQNPTSLSPRFDVVTVLLGAPEPTITHFPAAFESSTAITPA